MHKIFGAKAKVLINYKGDLQGLAVIIGKGLILPGLKAENSEEPPYDYTVSYETLGFELWINRSDLVEGYNFLLEIETELSYEESSLGQMHDISSWLGRFIARICEIDTAVFDENDNLLLFPAASA